MLDTISKQINTDLQKEKDRQDFYDLIHEDVEFNNFIDNKFLNLNENGVSSQMLKNEMPFLFIEDTLVDDDLITNLQNEVEYEDKCQKKPISDMDVTTKLQEPENYDDNFDAKFASDADPDTNLTKEVEYSDNQKTPVNIDEFSNEAADLLFEMGDILGALDLMEDADMTVPNEVDCPDEGEPIPQADEAKVGDTENPDMPEGVVMEAEEEIEEGGDEAEEGGDEAEVSEDSSLEEDFFALFESSDEDDDDCEECDEEDEDDDESEEDDDKDDEEDKEEEDDDKDDEDESEEDDKKSESFSILDLF